MKSILLLVFVIFSQSAWSQSSDLKINMPVEKFTLENGLVVLLHRDPTIPMVSFHTWYKVGSQNERPGITGSAHMLEHMMFKGAEKYSNKEFDMILHSNGITNNAFTSFDITGYYEILPSDKLELIMDLERDRMTSLLLKEEDLKSEQEVVAEERRWRVDNNPQSLLREQAMEILFAGHSYRWPVIGYMKDIQNFDIETLRKFYNQYYGPNNAVLVVAGDIDLVKTKELVKQYYGPLKVRPVPKSKKAKLKPLKQKKTITLEKDVQVPSLMISYQSVQDQHPDSYALQVLGQILANGLSSRLSKDLVYKRQWANATAAYQWSMKEGGLWGLFLSLKPDAKDKKVLEAVDREIFRIRHQLVSDRELKRAQNQYMSEFVDDLSTVDAKARALASAEIISGDYNNLFTDLEKYQKVTVHDVRRVAKKYLNPNARVVAWLKPTSKPTTTPKKSAAVTGLNK